MYKPKLDKRKFLKFVKEERDKILFESKKEALKQVNDYLAEHYPDVPLFESLPNTKTKIKGETSLKGAPIFYENYSDDCKWCNYGIAINIYGSTDGFKWHNKGIKLGLYEVYKAKIESNPRYFDSEEYRAKKAIEDKEIARAKEQDKEQAKREKIKAEEKEIEKHKDFLLAYDGYIKASIYNSFNQSAYFIKKKVDAYAHHAVIAYNPDNKNIFIPLYSSEGKVAGIQKIYFDSKDSEFKKYNLGKVAGNFGLIGCTIENAHKLNSIYVTEGLATGLSLYSVTQTPVIITLSSVNITKSISGFLDYCKQENSQYVEPNIIIAADNDQWRDKKNLKGVKKEADEINAGISAALKAIEEGGFKNINYCFPEFSEESAQKNPTDYNDLLVLEGLSTVVEYMKPTPICSIEEPTTSNEGVLNLSFVMGAEYMEEQDSDELSQTFDINKAININADHFIKSDLESRQYLINDFIPAEIPFLITAAGGTGKSYFALQMLVAVASGAKFMDFDTSEPQPVLGYFMEEDENELTRRLQAILVGMEENNIQFDKNALNKNLKIISHSGTNVRLVRLEGNTLVETDNALYLTEAIQKHNAKLCILDPLRTLTDGDENMNHIQNRFIECIEGIRNTTSCAIGLVHHTSKSDKSGSRGASALVDGVRLQMSLEVVDSVDVTENKIIQNQNRKKKSTTLSQPHVVLSIGKSNYTSKFTKLGLFKQTHKQGIFLHHINSIEQLLKLEETKLILNIIKMNEKLGNLKNNTQNAIFSEHKEDKEINGEIIKGHGLSQKKTRDFIHKLKENGIIEQYISSESKGTGSKERLRVSPSYEYIN